MKSYQRLLYSILSGFILYLAWTKFGLGLALLAGFVPLLFVEDYFYQNRDKYRSIRVFFLSYLAFFTWNLVTTWWIYNASLFGACGAIICNSLFMAGVFWAFHITRRKLGNKIGYFSLVVYWVGFEYLHLNWDLSWPWLTIGNGFSHNIMLIQWYEYTGILGGSLWAMIVNVLLFLVLKNYTVKHNFLPKKRELTTLILVLFLPVIFSIIRFYTYTEKKCPRTIVALQPNIDPYNDKFGGMPEEKQLEILLNLAASKGDGTTDFFVAPETALPDEIWEENIQKYPDINNVRKFLSKYPKAKFVIGISSAKEFKPGEKVTATARKYRDGDGYYDSYNTAALLDTSSKIQLYHKSELVIGVEKIPYPRFFNMFKGLAINLGGTVGSLGVQEERTAFTSFNDSVRVAPVICYESIYGEFVTGYIKNGANLIFVITNDGWWGDTPGFDQHLTYSCLRAIETRRSVARSANTGISCFIDQRGEMSQVTSWWQPAVIKGQLNANDAITYYVRFGDYIGKMAAILAVIVFLVQFVATFRRKKAVAKK